MTVLSFVVGPDSLLLLLHLLPCLVLCFAYYALLELFKALLAVLGVRWEGELQSFIVLSEYFVNGLVLGVGQFVHPRLAVCPYGYMSG